VQFDSLDLRGADFRGSNVSGVVFSASVKNRASAQF
jgi:uncharacterized protein YjbI with pentapeptide repeats